MNPAVRKTLFVIGFTLAGISQIILLKYQNYYKVENDSGKKEFFIHPMLQVTFLFLGQTVTSLVVRARYAKHR